MSIAPMRRRTRVQTHGRRAPTAPTRRQLQELEAELRRDLARFQRSHGDAAPAGGSSGDAVPSDAGRGRAPADAEEGVAVALESRAHARHAAVVAALARLEEGRYGRCAICGERIPFGRLQVMPESLHCIACGPRA